MDSDDSSHEWTQAPSTAPDNFPMMSSGCDFEEGEQIAGVLRYIVQELGRLLDLDRLDGITFAADYSQALAKLDRGFESTIPLEPSTEHGTGIAMTPLVMRDGVVKSYIVFDLAVVRHITDVKNEHWQLAFNLIAHECAHVHDHKKFDVSFPGLLLRTHYRDVEEGNLWQIIHACWVEYAATRLSSGFGFDQTSAYEETFLVVLSAAQQRANDRIKAYRLHGDHAKILADVCTEYGTLLKFASYLIGQLAGLDRDLSAAPKAESALAGHWFAPFFIRLAQALEGVWERYGKWTSVSDFDPVGEVAKDLVAWGGVLISRTSSNQVRIDVPFSLDTMP
jgi:hypothetical protein